MNIVLTLFLFALVAGCKKTDENIVPKDPSVNTPTQPQPTTWTWRKTHLSTLAPTGEVSTFAGYPGTFGSNDGFGQYAQLSGVTGITTDGIFLYVFGKRSINHIF